MHPPNSQSLALSGPQHQVTGLCLVFGLVTSVLLFELLLIIPVSDPLLP